ncbi:SgcJ/EcaC family oxidoreductase [Acidobacterium sp. S8]|uniref:YybH family protein n=1 Tax=Acidobacterium sp. S8 TaxID=1641854 RepID=UPI001C20B337|nr:nuclear transport factor 2 family protein [Acidobacterium sp. S8]
MRWKTFVLWCALAGLWLIPQRMIFAQDAESAIRHVLMGQVEAWNRGDIDGFMEGYQNSPETTFVGKTIHHGWQQVQERYKHDYATKESRGTLEFSDLTVRLLGADYAVTTGKYHLTRSAAGGGDASGVFSLVWQKSKDGWKIILDHTS